MTRSPRRYPSSGPPAPPEAIFASYRALSDALAIPIFVQNHDAPYGTQLIPEFVTRLIRELPGVDWIKEET